MAHFHYVLSMGAVFALYSAWYFWIPKILGLDYNKPWGKTHFWVLFIGVNITFFPQHFLGLQGMPRRISDYPDAFAGWNLVSSFGSIVSVIATWLFLYILYVQLTEPNATPKYPWLTPQFYYYLLQTHLTRAFNSLEWALNSPPKQHAFTSLPVESSPLRLLNPVTPGIPPLLTFCCGAFFIGTFCILGSGGIGGFGMPTPSAEIDPTLFVSKREIYKFLYDISYMLMRLVRSESHITWEYYEFIFDNMVGFKDVIANNLGEQLEQYNQILELMEKFIEGDNADLREAQILLNSMVERLAERGWANVRHQEWVVAFHNANINLSSDVSLIHIFTRLYVNC